jgi:thiol-disulfide isomerase/thioredoxin
MMPAPPAILLDAPMALYLSWVAVTIALFAVGVVWMFRPAIGSQPLKRLGIGWAVITVLVIVVSARVFGNRSQTLTVFPRAPEFSLRTVDGQSFSRNDLHGKVILLEFWASWCGPCREALPEMFRLHQEFGDRRFVMIGVSEDEDQTKFEDFVAQKGIRWPQDWDPEGKLLSSFSSDAIPSYALIGPDGRLRFLQKGYTPDTYLRLRQAISDALSNSEASLKP